MKASLTDQPVAWDPPGPGEWIALTDHFPRPPTAFVWSVLPAAAERGWAAAFDRAGLPMRTVRVHPINGIPYVHPVPLLGPDRPTPLPPAVLVRMLAAVHPALRRCERHARSILTERGVDAWFDEWFRHDRATWLEKGRALALIDPAVLDDQDLTLHVTDLAEFATDALAHHLSLHLPNEIALGQLLAFATEHHIDPELAINCLTGAATKDLVRPDEPGDWTWRVATHYDVDSPTFGELTNQVPPINYAATDGSEATAAFLEATPPAQRQRAAQLVNSARTGAHCRDDNGAILSLWPLGLLRRALLELGARLAARDQIEHPDLALEATPDEARDLLNRSDLGPTLTARRDARHAVTATAAPPRIGAAAPAPDPKGFPTHLRELFNAFSAFMSYTEQALAPRPLRGHGIGSQVIDGIAVVVSDPAHITHVEVAGRILVTATTSPVWLPLIESCAGLVTAHGNFHSHAAIIARALDIPAIIGAIDAVDLIPNGSRVRLDPREGVISIVAEPSRHGSTP